MPKLTKGFVETLEAREVPYLVFDEIVPGFCVRILPSTSKARKEKGTRKSYYLQYRKNKITKRLLLGQHGIITAEQARNKAIIALATIKEGGDPQTEKSLEKRSPLMLDLAKRFIVEHILVRCKANTQKRYNHQLQRHILPSLGNIKVSEVTRADISTLQHSLKHIPESANHCISIASKMFSLAEMWGWRTENTNPCKYVKNFSSKARDRYLSREEAKRLGDVLDEIKQYPDENLSAAHCIQLLMLTGCRLGEIQTLKWEYIDYENELLRLPDSKTGAKIVYVGDAVMGLLQEINDSASRPQDNPYVVWGKNAGSHLNNIQRPWRRFRKLAGLDDVHIHDLRHSFASFAVNGGMSLPMIGKLLGHTQAQTTSRYAHLMAGPMKEAANSVTCDLGRLLKLKAKSRDTQQEAQAVVAVTINGTNIKAPKYLTSAQSAEYLNVKQSLLVYWRGQKTGPLFVKVGHRIRYTTEALDEFVQTASKMEGLRA